MIQYEDLPWTNKVSACRNALFLSNRKVGDSLVVEELVNLDHDNCIQVLGYVLQLLYSSVFKLFSYPCFYIQRRNRPSDLVDVFPRVLTVRTVKRHNGGSP